MGCGAVSRLFITVEIAPLVHGVRVVALGAPKFIGFVHRARCVGLKVPAAGGVRRGTAPFGGGRTSTAQESGALAVQATVLMEAI